MFENRKCPFCGTVNPKGENFCVNCGGVIDKPNVWYRGSTKAYYRSSAGQVTNFLFTVGQNEKHYIAVKFNTKGGKFTVFVDSSDVPHPIQRVGPKSVSLDVGQEEKHKVTLAISGFWVQNLEALVDGSLAYKSQNS